MAIYNVNQNRQFYTIGSIAVDRDPIEKGELEVCSTKDNQIFFKHLGEGGLTRSDLIDLDKICYARFTPKAQMRRYPKKATVSLNPDYLIDGKPIVGQDYVLRIQINNFLAPGDACVYIKSSAVRGLKGMTVDKFYEKMVESLEKNFSREPQKLLTFKKTDDGVVITEVTDQPWRRGVLSQSPVNFEIIATTVTYEGEEVVWASTNEEGFIPVEEDNTLPPVGNGKEVADLEYFCQAERGDMFRNMGWPNNIDVKYMVDPSKEYDMLDIHYFFSGNGVQSHKSEKDLTIVSYENKVLDTVKSTLELKGVKITTAGATV